MPNIVVTLNCMTTLNEVNFTHKQCVEQYQDIHENLLVGPKYDPKNKEKIFLREFFIPGHKL